MPSWFNNLPPELRKNIFDRLGCELGASRVREFFGHLFMTSPEVLFTGHMTLKKQELEMVNNLVIQKVSHGITQTEDDTNRMFFHAVRYFRLVRTLDFDERTVQLESLNDKILTMVYKLLLLSISNSTEMAGAAGAFFVKKKYPINFLMNEMRYMDMNIVKVDGNELHKITLLKLDGRKPDNLEYLLGASDMNFMTVLYTGNDKSTELSWMGSLDYMCEWNRYHRTQNLNLEGYPLDELTIDQLIQLYMRLRNAVRLLECTDGNDVRKNNVYDVYNIFPEYFVMGPHSEVFIRVDNL
jgi:hypothetical protein